MMHNPELWTCDGAAKPKWEYTPTLMARAFLELYQDAHDTAYLNHAQRFADQFIGEDGTIMTYKQSLYNMDRIQGGNFLIMLQAINPQPQYSIAIETLRDQLRNQPRTSEGGFWHKQVYPNQMWLDGLYMAQPFYAEYTNRYVTDSTARAANYDDIVLQFRLVYDGTYDPETGLLRHAWDSSREMFWSDEETGQSAHSWGRAMGWYAMALVDVAELLPEGSEWKDEVIGLLKSVYEALPLYADHTTGMWYQVLDRPYADGNYLEATCNAMFVYAWLKGVRLGFLEGRESAVQAYEALLKTFVTKDDDGLVNLNDCCEVAGLGGKGNRSGDFDYYISEPVRSNDPKGIGPLIWAALEYERL